MYIDASALTAIMTNEDDAQELLARMQKTKTRVTSPLAVWETTVAVSRILQMDIGQAIPSVENYLRRIGVEIVSIAPDLTKIALDAFDRYGKGRHPAQLNFGDCFGYACSRHLGYAMLYKGRDFALTDIEAA